MQGNPAIIDALNEILSSELAAINQYFIHSKMCRNWGYGKLAKKAWDASIDEMKDADKIIERILFLEGVPNMQRMNPVRVGEDVAEQHKLDYESETNAITQLNKGIALSRDNADNGTRELLEEILEGEEEQADWLDAQLNIIKNVGIKNYLTEQIHE